MDIKLKPITFDSSIKLKRKTSGKVRKVMKNHTQRLKEFNVEKCKGDTSLHDGIHSHAFNEGNLCVENFVFSKNHLHLEYKRQRVDFSKEEIEKVEQEWLRMMVNPKNLGKKIGLTPCTKDKAKYLTSFIK